MNTLPALCPITGLGMQPCFTAEATFKGLQYSIPSISPTLVVSLAANVLENTELCTEMMEKREKFAKNLQMVAKLRQEIIISSGNWWLFLQ